MENYYNPMFTYTPTPKDIEVAKSFADRVSPTTFDIYKKRDISLTKERHIQNHFESAITEIASVYFLRSKGFQCSDPDFSIHEIKTFSADLVAIHQSNPNVFFNIHVKSQTVPLMKWCGTPSYNFTTSDKLITSPKPNDLLILTVIKTNAQVDIVSFEHCIRIFPKFVKPTLKNHRSKRAIYWRDIVKDREKQP